MTAMAGLLHDLRHAVRRLRARPGFTLAVLVVLAAGIGANTAAFSLVRGVLLRPLPWPDSESIVRVGRTLAERPGPLMLSYGGLRRLRDDARSFEHLAGYAPRFPVWDGPDGPANLVGAAVTPSLFPLLRAAPRIGRLFTEAEAVEGADRVVLLSDRAWSERFGSDPDVVGAAIVLSGDPHAVLGVLPADFDFPGPGLDFWKPLVAPPDEPSPAGGVFSGGALAAVGRLRPGVPPVRAEIEARTILARASDFDPAGPGGPAVETRVSRLREERARPFRPALLMLSAATGLLLTMACANVAGLLLARGLARRRELALRGALGAPRARLVRQLLTESVMLSVAGGAAGLAVAAGVLRAAPALAPGGVPGLDEAGIDGGVLAFAAGLSLAAGLVFGAAPAFACSRVDPARALNEEGVASAGGFGGRRTNAGQAGLAVAQVALALVLLTGAGLLLRSFVALVTFDLGLDPAGVVAASVQTRAAGRLLGGAGGRIDPDELTEVGAAFRRSAETLLARLDRIAALPGVDSVALSSDMPLLPEGSVQYLAVAGRPPPREPRDRLTASIRRVSPGYAEVLRLRRRAGRFFTDRDTAGSPRVAVVSESFARAAFPGEPAVGQRLAPAFPFPGGGGPGGGEAGGSETWEVVGVVADVTSPFVPAEFTSTLAGEIYLSMFQPGMDTMPGFGAPTVVVRAGENPLAVVPFLREALADVEPGMPVDTIVLETMLSARAAQPRFYAAAAGVFGLAALLLAAFGLYAVLACAVSRRRREIGVRVALGAGRGDIRRLVLRQGGVIVAAGVLLGLLAAAAGVRIAGSILHSVTPADPLTFAAVTAVLAAVALLACWLPARRAARIEPLEVLRET